MATRKTAVALDPVAVILSLPAELAETAERCLCGKCEPDMSEAERARIEGEYKDRSKRKYEWLAERGVSPLTALRNGRNLHRFKAATNTAEGGEIND